MKKRSAAVLMAALCALSTVGCVKSSSETTTKISVINFDGGVGVSWLDGAIARFEELKKDEVYEEGKKGVTFKEPKNEQGISTDTMGTAGYNIYFTQAATSVRDLAQKGLLMDISDIVTEKLTAYGETGSIEDKVEENYRQMIKGADGKYYGLPHYEYYPGISYDVEHFEKYNLYFAAEGEEDVETYTAFGKTSAFCGQDYSAKKSCGSDGVYNTSDDGMPTSLMELLVLCSRMEEAGIKPFTLSGQNVNYSNYIVQSLWASIAGYEQLRVCYEFEGELDIITGWTGEKLIPGIDYIEKPVVETVTISAQNNNQHLIYDQVARYYAISFLEIIQREGWFYKDANSTSASHTATQGNFIFNGKTINGNTIDKIGMILEGSYWYQESQRAENFSDYKMLQNAEKEVAWMTLPTSFDTTVTENNGRKNTLLESGAAYAYINNNISDNAGLTRACKEFLQFLYTDAELQAFTMTSGSAKAVSYELTEENKAKMANFPRSIWEIRKDSNIVYAGATNPTFLKSSASFLLRGTSFALSPKYGATSYKNFLAPIIKGAVAKDLYKATCLTADIWAGLYQGE